MFAGNLVHKIWQWLGKAARSIKVYYFHEETPEVHSNFSLDFMSASSLRTGMVKELKKTLQRQESPFTKPTKKANAAAEASFKVE